MSADPKLINEAGQPFDPAAYEIVLRPLTQDEGGGWFATIPALPGCMGDGESEGEAIADVRAAALEWADACVVDGESVPAPVMTDSIAAE